MSMSLVGGYWIYKRTAIINNYSIHRVCLYPRQALNFFTMKHDYHTRQQQRIDNAKRRSLQNKQKADNFIKTADHIAHVTQGEPIKIGHHSEGRHRRDLNKMDKSLHGSIEASRKADYYAGKAAAIEGNTSISSDNPDAIELLEDKLKKLMEKQQWMKDANKEVKKKNLQGFLQLKGMSQAIWNLLVTPAGGMKAPFEPYELSNNNARIKQTRERLEQLRKDSQRVTIENLVKGVTVIKNAEAGRIQLRFPAKPEEAVRQRLKKQFGFIWCRSLGVWQRQLNNAGIDAANRFFATYNIEDAPEKGTQPVAS